MDDLVLVKKLITINLFGGVKESNLPKCLFDLGLGKIPNYCDRQDKEYENQCLQIIQIIL